MAFPAQVGSGEGGREEAAVGQPLDEVAVALDPDHLEAPGPAVVVAAPDLDPGAGRERPWAAARRLPRIDHWDRSLPARRPLGNRRLGLGLCLLALALALVVGGCSLAKGLVSTGEELGKAGFGAADFEVDSGDRFRVTVTKDTEDLPAAATEAAAVVWRELPLRIEGLEVACTNGFGGRGTFRADRAELERRFGPRDPALDEGFQESDVRTVVVVVIALVLGGLVVLAGVVVLIVVLVRRNRHRGPPPGPPGPPGWGTQPPPPGYGPPA